ncbi:MAG: (Fe-S)-binding protein [Desulfovibrionaceae bacterium]|nr:(Fe-S)-binding protein [Desulfovibrionaceae bacterium]
MSDLNSLAQRLMALDDKLVACMRCGMCQAVCPMFGATMMEADVARGKLALVSNLAHRMIEDPQAVADKLGRCLLCGSCQANCPSGVHIMDIFMEAREIVYNYIGLHPLKKLIFRFLLPNPGLFSLGMRIGAPCQGLLFKSKNNVQETTAAPLLDGILGARHIRSLAPKSLLALEGAQDTPAGASGIKVAFYPGCMGDKFYVSMGQACLKVLRHHGVGIYMPKGFACCGIPALSSGDAEGMLKEMKVSLAEFAKGEFDYVVTPCASCTSTIKELWPRYAGRIGEAEQAQAEALSAKTMDINAFLINVLKVEPKAAPADNAVPVTYHDSCHMKKSLGVVREPRAVIGLNPGYRLVEMAEADRCCGCGGSFNLFHYDLSRQIGQRKRNNVVASGAKVAAAGCPACMMQLEDVLSQNGDPVEVKHTIELYAETLK